MVKVTLSYECGETTCATEPGKFCRFLGAIHFGQVPVCMLFDNRELQEKEGWTQRCEECLEAEQEGQI
jgi:hypothetical protein